MHLLLTQRSASLRSQRCHDNRHHHTLGVETSIPPSRFAFLFVPRLKPRQAGSVHRQRARALTDDQWRHTSRRNLGRRAAAAIFRSFPPPASRGHGGTAMVPRRKVVLPADKLLGFIQLRAKVPGAGVGGEKNQWRWCLHLCI